MGIKNYNTVALNQRFDMLELQKININESVSPINHSFASMPTILLLSILRTYQYIYENSFVSNEYGSFIIEGKFGINGTQIADRYLQFVK